MTITNDVSTLTTQIYPWTCSHVFIMEHERLTRGSGHPTGACRLEYVVTALHRCLSFCH